MSDGLEQLQEAVTLGNNILDQLENSGNIPFDDSMLISVIMSCDDAIYRSSVSTCFSTFFTSLQNHPDFIAELENFKTQWDDKNIENYDDQAFEDFKKSLLEFSSDNNLVKLDDLTLYDVFEQKILPYFNNIFREFINIKKRFENVLKRKKSDYQVYMDTDFITMDPYEFETFISKLFMQMGYEVKVTKKSGDFGVDVIAKNAIEVIAIQTKKYTGKNLVGNVDVQKLLGAMNYKDYLADRSILITTTDFTRKAIEQASGNNIELWNKEKLYEKIIKYMLRK